MLNPEQISQYLDEGYLVLKNFADQDECRSLRERAADLVSNGGPIVDPRCGFTSGFVAQRFVSHEFFVESLNGVKCFFEASTISPDGRILIDNHEAIVKIGHALHDYDHVFEKYSHSSRMHEI